VCFKLLPSRVSNPNILLKHALLTVRLLLKREDTIVNFGGVVGVVVPLVDAESSLCLRYKVLCLLDVVAVIYRKFWYLWWGSLRVAIAATSSLLLLLLRTLP
jgi:hypothetical protein